MIALGEREDALLRFIVGYQMHHGVSPSQRECVTGTGFRKGLVPALLTRLARAQRIAYRPRKHRGIDVIEAISVPRAPDGAALYAIQLSGEQA